MHLNEIQIFWFQLIIQNVIILILEKCSAFSALRRYLHQHIEIHILRTCLPYFRQKRELFAFVVLTALNYELLHMLITVKDHSRHFIVILSFFR